MIEPRQPSAATNPSLFPVTTVPLGESIVLLARSIAVAQIQPSAFQDLGVSNPENVVMMGDFALIDFGGIQCLVLPGEPRRMQVQVAPGRRLVEAVPFAMRLFSNAIGPTSIGMNFGWKLQFSEGNELPVREYLNVEGLDRLVSGEILSIGFNVRWQDGSWRGHLQLTPGQTKAEMNWQVNFERSAGSRGEIEAALHEIDSVIARELALRARVLWRT